MSKNFYIIINKSHDLLKKYISAGPVVPKDGQPATESAALPSQVDTPNRPETTPARPEETPARPEATPIRGPFEQIPSNGLEAGPTIENPVVVNSGNGRHKS